MANNESNGHAMSAVHGDYHRHSSNTSCHGQSGVGGKGDAVRPFLIGVAGGTASGKSTVCQKIIKALQELNADGQHQKRVEMISQECFYRILNETEIAAANRGQFDFDHPNAFDDKLMKQTLSDMMAGKEVTLPVYDCIVYRRSGTRVVKPADVILFEGILAFYYPELTELFNVKLFVDTDADTRLARRVERDMKERNRPLEHILHQYVTYVKPAFEEFCLPTKKYADVIIPRGADNVVAVDLIVQHVQDLLRNGHKTAEPAFTRSLSVLSTDSATSFKLSDDYKYMSAH